jgi:NADH:ubiquinone oxidoreductase subunit 3 (subunit A)
MIINSYAVIGLILLVVIGSGFLLIGFAYLRIQSKTVPSSWKQYHFGFVMYTLILLAFDMEMVFMYPWAVVFSRIGVEAFIDMFVFIVILLAAIVYAWRIGVFIWEQ